MAFQFLHGIIISHPTCSAFTMPSRLKKFFFFFLIFLLILILALLGIDISLPQKNSLSRKTFQVSMHLKSISSCARRYPAECRTFLFTYLYNFNCLNWKRREQTFQNCEPFVLVIFLYCSRVQPSNIFFYC